MAGDRGRDLTLNLVSNLDRFTTDDAAADLDKLGEATSDAGRELGDLESSASDAQRELRRLATDAAQGTDDLDKMGRAAKDADLEKLGDDARTTARKVDGALDDIARSAKVNLGRSGKLADAADEGGKALDGVREEADSTAREMAASFGGSTDDIVDGFQELAANALTEFGPIGAAIGTAAALGVGLLRAETEKMKELVSDLTEDMLANAGQLSDAFIDTKLQTMAQNGELTDLKESAELAGVEFGKLARAKAGDGEAAASLMEDIDKLNKSLGDQYAKSGQLVDINGTQRAALKLVRGELGESVKAYGLAREAVDLYGSVSKESTDAAAESTRVATERWAALGRSYGTPVRGRVTVSQPSAADLANARAAAQAWLDAHPNVVRIRADIADLMSQTGRW